MANHWQGAQKQAQEEGWGNFVFTLDSQVCIAGSPDRGWVIVSSQYNLRLQARIGTGGRASIGSKRGRVIRCEGDE